MYCGRACAFWTLAVVSVLTLPAGGQSVISTRSGVVYFFEGTVYLGDQLLEFHPGKFSSVPQGAELRTGEGRAEVLLTPGVFVRMGERSTIRMIANELSDTRVELLAGSAVVDSAQPSPGTSVALLYKTWSIRSLEPGAYRIDSDPPRLSVLRGKVQVSAGNKEEALSVAQGMYVPLAPVLVPDRSIDEPNDALSLWAEGRQQSISADNAIAANIQDPASMSTTNSGFDSFTYFPTLGLPSYGSGLYNVYSSLGAYQPGFTSIYLPGYTYLPLLVGSGWGGFPTLLRSSYAAGRPIVPPHAPIAHPIVARPVFLHPTPVSPVSPHPIPLSPVSRGGTHASVHR